MVSTAGRVGDSAPKMHPAKSNLYRKLSESDSFLYRFDLDFDVFVTDGRMDGQTDGRTHGRRDGRDLDGHGRTDGRTDGRIRRDGYGRARTDGRTDGY